MCFLGYHYYLAGFFLGLFILIFWVFVVFNMFFCFSFLGFLGCIYSVFVFPFELFWILVFIFEVLFF